MSITYYTGDGIETDTLPVVPPASTRNGDGWFSDEKYRIDSETSIQTNNPNFNQAAFDQWKIDELNTKNLKSREVEYPSHYEFVCAFVEDANANPQKLTDLKISVEDINTAYPIT